MDSCGPQYYSTFFIVSFVHYFTFEWIINYSWWSNTSHRGPHSSASQLSFFFLYTHIFSPWKGGRSSSGWSHLDALMRETFGPRASDRWRKQMMIIVLADKTDPHLPAANASFFRSVVRPAASDEWCCLLCSVWCQRARCPCRRHLTSNLRAKRRQVSAIRGETNTL